MPPSQKSVAIILSSAYVASSMVSEFGLLPPAFLPLANKRLYCWQVASLRDNVGSVMLTIPQNFQPEAFDIAWLRDHQVDLYAIEEGKTLGTAVAHCLARLHQDVDDVWLLFGDTLITDIHALCPDSLAVGVAKEYSRWGYCRPGENGSVAFSEGFETAKNDKDPVVAGCFRLDRYRLHAHLTGAGMDFYAALNLYAAHHALALVDANNCWHDLGHINAYFRSRQHFTTERAFNNLQIEKRRVAKYSAETLKMLAEIEWFENAPRDISVFLPGYWGRAKRGGLIGYATEYLFMPLVSDLFVYGRLPDYVWRQIFVGCKEFMQTCRAYRGHEEVAADSWWLYAGKTQERLDCFSRERGFSLQKPWLFNGQPMPSLQDIFQQTLSRIPPPTDDQISIIHGDFHLANIFFDFRSLGLRAVDPRGAVRGVPTLYGDYRYDLAKLSHSIYGLYDFIVAGIVTAQVTDSYDIAFVVDVWPSIKNIQRLFGSMVFNDLSPQSTEIRAIVILLFLSMLPLHGEDRQRQDTLLANVFRLYADMTRDEGVPR